MPCVVQHHVKVAHVSPASGAYLNIDEEVIARAPILDAKLSLKSTHEILDRAYLSYQDDTFKIGNAMVYQILSKSYMDMDAYVYM